MTIRPMLAGSGETTDLSNPTYWAEEKLDGTRVIIEVTPLGSVRIAGRSGNTYTHKYPELVKDIAKHPGIWDGELVFYDKVSGKVDFQTALITEESKNLRDWAFVVFDNLEWRDIPYDKRREMLEEWFGLWCDDFSHIKLTKICRGDKKAFYDEIIRTGGEGVVIKRLDSTYEEGARNKDWLKIKREETADLTVIGWTQGGGKREPFFGALIAVDEEGRQTSVGGGFVDRMLELIKKEYLLPDFKVKPFVIEIEYLNKTKASYRMPRMIRIRDDKQVLEKYLH